MPQKQPPPAIIETQMLLNLLVLAIAPTGPSIVAPNLSLDTVPVGYFGGNAAHRGQANIEMLAKMRLVMIEKWEGHCWQDCLAKPGSSACLPSCDAEASIIDTMRRIKAINHTVATVMYLNTLLAFPFYSLIGKYEAANALAIDSVTKKPIRLRNDNGMEDIFVYGFDKPEGQKLYLDAIKNYTATGVVDGFYGDKWNKGATPVDRRHPEGGWNICNKECGSMTAAQAKLWNEGKARVLQAATAYVGEGPYFSYGYYSAAPEVGNVSSNLDGKWGGSPGLKQKADPRDFITDVQGWLHGASDGSTPPHKYVFMNSQGDQHWTTDPNDPTSLQGSCVGDCLARFLLGVEVGVILGTDGWDPEYEKPLGDPLGPAVFTPGAAGKPATLTRSFKSGTRAVFTYDGKVDPVSGSTTGTGEVWWGGVKPPPPPPPPPPPTIRCGSCGSTVLVGVPFTGHELGHQVTTSAVACCELCAAAGVGCAQWTWWTRARGGHANMTCYQHAAAATRRASKADVVSGVMNRTTL
jgi:hypothetical protein